MAIKVLKFPSLSLTLIFWTGQTPGTFLTSLAPSLSLPWTLLFLDSAWSGLLLLKAGASGSKFDFDGSTFFSLWRERWWFFLHLSQVVPSAFVQSFVWWDTLKHFRHLLFSLTTSHFSLTVNPWYTGQEASRCLDLQPRGQDSSSFLLLASLAWWSVLLPPRSL